MLGSCALFGVVSGIGTIDIDDNTSLIPKIKKK